MADKDLLINELTLDVARQMLTYECELRKSDQTQELYTLIQTGDIHDRELIEDYVQYLTVMSSTLQHNVSKPAFLKHSSGSGLLLMITMLILW